jgi:heptosyltransferase-2
VFPKPYITFAICGMHFTKKLPTEKIISICKKRNETVVLIGGPEDFETGKIIESNCDNVINTCGKYNINESAFIVNNSDLLITHDTGMMHIAAALGKKVFSIFGGTHPNLGFTAYKPNSENRIIQIENLDCRPCHRYGKNKCPKGHFKCMQEIDENQFLSE